MAGGSNRRRANGNVVTGSIVTRYFFKDHLGSILLIQDELAAAVEQLSYDSWGKRRFIGRPAIPASWPPDEAGISQPRWSKVGGNLK